MLDWTERLTVALSLVFGLSLLATIYVDHVLAWLLWGVVMVLGSGAALVAVNRTDPPPDP